MFFIHPGPSEWTQQIDGSPSLGKYLAKLIAHTARNIAPTHSQAVPPILLHCPSASKDGESRRMYQAIRRSPSLIESRIICDIFLQYPASNWIWEILLESVAILKR